jgi:hypothetical protein
MKVGDLVDINQPRGTGSFEKITPRGLGVVGSYRACPVEHRRDRGLLPSELGGSL